MGSQAGDIAMFYLDEPVINKLNGKPWADGRVQEKELERSPFNIFNPHQSPRDNLGQLGALLNVNDDNGAREIGLFKKAQTNGSDD